MNNIEWLDLISPFLSALAAIIALTGNSYKENADKWFKKLNWRGKSMALLIMGSVFFSLINTSIEKNEYERSYRNLENSNDSILRILEKSRYHADSLNNLIASLNTNLINISSAELQEQRMLFKERNNIILKNAYNEIIQNVLAIESWEAIGTEKIIYKGNPKRKFKNEYLKQALSVPIDNNLLQGINFVITTIDELNDGIKYLEMVENIDYASRKSNVNTIFNSFILLKRNLQQIQNEFKRKLDGYSVKFKSEDSTDNRY